MKITKVMFVGLISLLCSINSFTNTNSENDFKKYVLEKLEEIKKIDIYNNDTTTKYQNRYEENSKRSGLKKFIIDNFITLCDDSRYILNSPTSPLLALLIKKFDNSLNSDRAFASFPVTEFTF